MKFMADFVQPLLQSLKYDDRSEGNFDGLTGKFNYCNLRMFMLVDRFFPDRTLKKSNDNLLMFGIFSLVALLVGQFFLCLFSKKKQAAERAERELNKLIDLLIEKHSKQCKCAQLEAEQIIPVSDAQTRESSSSEQPLPSEPEVPLTQTCTSLPKSKPPSDTQLSTSDDKAADLPDLPDLPKVPKVPSVTTIYPRKYGKVKLVEIKSSDSGRFQRHALSKSYSAPVIDCNVPLRELVVESQLPKFNHTI